MSDVSFNEESEVVQTPMSAPSTSKKGLYGLVIKMGLAKDEKQASGVLLVIALIAVAIAVIYPFLVL
jgi:hypothetical protein